MCENDIGCGVKWAAGKGRDEHAHAHGIESIDLHAEREGDCSAVLDLALLSWVAFKYENVRQSSVISVYFRDTQRPTDTHSSQACNW